VLPSCGINRDAFSRYMSHAAGRALDQAARPFCSASHDRQLHTAVRCVERDAVSCIIHLLNGQFSGDAQAADPGDTAKVFPMRGIAKA
jgi:hypothetical protein